MWAGRPARFLCRWRFGDCSPASNALGNAGPEIWVALSKQRNLSALYVIGHALRGGRDILKPHLSLLPIKQTERVPSLRVVVVSVAMPNRSARSLAPGRQEVCGSGIPGSNGGHRRS